MTINVTESLPTFVWVLFTLISLFGFFVFMYYVRDDSVAVNAKLKRGRTIGTAICLFGIAGIFGSFLQLTYAASANRVNFEEKYSLTKVTYPNDDNIILSDGETLEGVTYVDKNGELQTATLTRSGNVLTLK